MPKGSRFYGIIIKLIFGIIGHLRDVVKWHLPIARDFRAPVVPGTKEAGICPDILIVRLRWLGAICWLLWQMAS